jgi:hypothetical protein
MHDPTLIGKQGTSERSSLPSQCTRKALPSTCGGVWPSVTAKHMESLSLYPILWIATPSTALGDVTSLFRSGIVSRKWSLTSIVLCRARLACRCIHISERTLPVHLGMATKHCSIWPCITAIPSWFPIAATPRHPGSVPATDCLGNSGKQWHEINCLGLTGNIAILFSRQCTATVNFGFTFGIVFHICNCVSFFFKWYL